MGLYLEVGILVNLRKNDEEAIEKWKQGFEAINNILRAEGVPEHREPENLSEDQIRTLDYSNFHSLRRIAACNAPASVVLSSTS